MSMVPRTRKWPPPNPTFSTKEIEASAAKGPKVPPKWMPTRTPARPAPAVKPPAPAQQVEDFDSSEIPF